MLVNRGWVPPNWKAEWQQHFMAQQPQGLVTVSGVVQGSESPSSYVPDNKPEEGLFFWVDVPGLVSSSGSCYSTRLFRLYASSLVADASGCLEAAGSQHCHRSNMMSAHSLAGPAAPWQGRLPPASHVHAQTAALACQ